MVTPLASPLIDDSSSRQAFTRIIPSLL